MGNVEVIVPVAFFGMIFGIVVLVTYYRNKRIERTALIASGKDASIFKETERVNRLSAFKYGILLVGLAIGFIVGDVLAAKEVLTEPVAYLSMLFLFGGIALLIFYFLFNKNEIRQNKDSQNLV